MSTDYDHRRLDPLLVSRIRLAVMALLATLDEAEFTYLRDRVGASDGNLGAHMGRLVKSGYVGESKQFHQGRPQTRYRLTGPGRDALEGHLKQLSALLQPEREP